MSNHHNPYHVTVYDARGGVLLNERVYAPSKRQAHSKASALAAQVGNVRKVARTCARRVRDK